MIKPIRSACFDMSLKKAHVASSLKERIRLNKILTRSPQTGGLIGVSTTTNPLTGLDTARSKDSTMEQPFFSARENAKLHQHL
jgi:hypothetical protein